MARHQSGRALARTALLTWTAGALVLGLLSVPAQAVQLPVYATFRDFATNSSLSVADLTGAGASVVASGVRTDSYDIAADGSTVALVARTGVDTTPYYDSTKGLLVAHGGVTRLVATQVSASPVVSPDGLTVWFASANFASSATVAKTNVYSYDVTTNAVTEVTTNGPLTPAGNERLTHISVSPDNLHVAGTLMNFAPTAPYLAISSRLVVASLTATSATEWQSVKSASSSTQIYSETPQWLGNSSLLLGVCPTSDCAAASYSSVDVSSLANLPVAMPLLDGAYNIRKLGTTWYTWSDSVAGVTSLRTSTDDFTSLNAPQARTDGTHTTAYIPTTYKPVAISTVAPLGRPASQSHLVLSASVVKTGGRAIYASYSYYLKAVTPQTFANDATEVDRGALQYSIDGGRHWKLYGLTSSAKLIAWPGSGYGNGYTQKLTRNTWFKWGIATDPFVLGSGSATSVVKVSPTVAAKVSKSGSKRTVYGTAARIGGYVMLYKGAKKIATVKLTSKGAYTFGKRTLAKGTYAVVTVVDASWAQGWTTVKV